MTIVLSSCDAYISLHYVVRNKSSDEAALHLQNYDPYNPFSFESIDTTIFLAPGESLVVGHTIDINFPWATKNIYKQHPGICGIQVQEKDSVQLLPCDAKSWHYKKRNSIYTIS